MWIRYAKITRQRFIGRIVRRNVLERRVALARYRRFDTVPEGPKSAGPSSIFSANCLAEMQCDDCRQVRIFIRFYLFARVSIFALFFLAALLN